jgi:hypothetical protein
VSYYLKRRKNEMSRRVDIKDFFEKISLAQKISDKDPHIKKYAGSDVELAKQIATLEVFRDYAILPLEESQFIIDLLVEQNKATFASSEKTDIFTKLGLLFPKKEKAFGLGVLDADQDDPEDETIILKKDR